MPPQPSNAEVLTQVKALAEDMLELLSASVRQAGESGRENLIAWFRCRLGSPA
ncbi:hypothetical protein [Nonomuraea sp. NPDC050643]|uniref:hypothetical protein n=1 Tax=Nonomuraea sp. NPDC050643 TaxID=3155660 RepID=UPI0033DF7B6B